GGTESMSRIPLLYNPEATELFLRLGRSKGWRQRLSTFLRFRPRHFHPVAAVKLGLTDPVSGLIMGETAEVLAEEFGISRREQDEFAVESHLRAAAAQERCDLSSEITPVPAEAAGREIKEDIGLRKDQSLEALSKLKPVFKPGGTVTVGNSCMLTDGAAAVVLLPGEAARAE